MTIKPANNHTLYFVSHHVRLKVVTIKFPHHVNFSGSWCQIESCYFPHHVIFLWFLVVHFSSFYFPAQEHQFLHHTQSTFMLFFCLLLMHSKGAKIGSTQQDKCCCNRWHKCVVSCSNWLCRKNDKMKMVVMTFYIMLFCIQLLQLYITGLHKMVTGKRIVNMGSQTCTCIVTFCKLIATAMVLSQEGLKF